MMKDYRITKPGVIVLALFIVVLVVLAVRHQQQWQPCTPEQTRTLQAIYNIKFDDYNNSFSCQVKL